MKNSIVEQFEAGDLTAEEALKLLGELIKVAKRAGTSTKHLQSAVDAILEMPSELEEDPSSDPEWAESYLNRRE